MNGKQVRAGLPRSRGAGFRDDSPLGAASPPFPLGASRPGATLPQHRSPEHAAERFPP